jgi:hypothetical protein
LGGCLHVEHPRLKPFVKEKGERDKTKSDTKNLDATGRATKLRKGMNFKVKLDGAQDELL